MAKIKDSPVGRRQEIGVYDDATCELLAEELTEMLKNELLRSLKEPESANELRYPKGLYLRIPLNEEVEEVCDGNLV